jgi:carboxypeptidase PM20D1
VAVEKVASHGGPVSEPSDLFDVLELASVTLDGDPLVVPSLTAGMTDIRYFRSLGATGYGWVPLILSPEQLATIHGHDERVSVNDLERAVTAMMEVVTRATSSA